MEKVPTLVVATPNRGDIMGHTISAVMHNATRAFELKLARPAKPEWWCLASGFPIPESHERVAAKAMASGAELIWFVEADNVPPPDALVQSIKQMRRKRGKLVAVTYPVGDEPGGIHWDSIYREDGEILFTGLGSTLVHRDVFEKLDKPWFRLDRRLTRKDGKLTITKSTPEFAGGVDVFFCMRAREAGFKLYDVPGLIGSHIRVRAWGQYPANDGVHKIELWEGIDMQQAIFDGKDHTRFSTRGRIERETMDTFTKRFLELGPWASGFYIDGEHYGSTKFDPINDHRIVACIKRFPGAKRVLELGSLEGGHTIALARNVDEVVGVEARSSNIARANFIMQKLEVRNAKIIKADLEDYDLSQLGPFDLVVCVGVLYHMTEPKKLLAQFPKIAPKLFLWTHHTGSNSERHLATDVNSPLSGTVNWERWLPQRALVAELFKHYKTVEILDNEANHKGAGPAITIAAEDPISPS